MLITETIFFNIKQGTISYLGLNESGRESEDGDEGGRPLVLLVRTNLKPGVQGVDNKENPVTMTAGQ